jgi:hypothetical protein
MVRPQGIAKCYVCQRPVPLALINSHHVHPKESGGSDSKENLCNLDAACHQNLHRLAEFLQKGKGGAAEDVARQFYKSPQAVQRILLLASRVIQCQTVFNERVPKSLRESTSTKTISLELPSTDYQQLACYAAEQKDSEGASLTVPKYVLKILQYHLRTHR